jgi:hypothetical protein
VEHYSFRLCESATFKSASDGGARYLDVGLTQVENPG